LKVLFNPLNTIRRFLYRIGKPVRPIIELQKDGSIVNIITNTVQDGNIISDTHKVEAWEVYPDNLASAIYIDGLFKGMGFFAGEEGQILKIKKDVVLMDYKGETVTAAYKGIFGKLLDASLYERGSALKPSMTQTIIYCILVAISMFMAGMSYGGGR
jgi:hypothetical protein